MQFFLDGERKILLAKVTGVLSDPKLYELCAALARLFALYGPCRGILDLCDLSAVTLTANAIRDKAENYPIFRGQKRVIVASSDLMFGLAQMFRIIQSVSQSAEDTDVVRTMQEAYEIMGIDTENFQAISLPVD